MRNYEGDHVVISGMGAILANAGSCEEAWRNLLKGHCGVDRFDYTGTDGLLHTALAAQTRDTDYRALLPDLSERHLRKCSRDILVTMAAAEMAVRDACLCGETPSISATIEPGRAAIYASTSRGPLQWWHQHYTTSGIDCGGALQPHDGILASMAGSPATMTAIRLGVVGEVLTLSNACIGGHQALRLGMDSIASGRNDVAIVIGHEFPIVPGVLDIYSAEKTCVLSRAVAAPNGAMKPYDVNRDGFVLGEGAVVLVLERQNRVRARGMSGYAVIEDVMSASEAAHPTRMDTSGSFMAKMVEQLLARDGKTPRHVQYVCGHGTATRLNDLAEARALTRLYGEDPRTSPPLTSIKPVFGHLLGASSLLNCMATALMIKNQVIAPTANCAEPDPECPQDHVTGGPRETSIENALSFAFAIGSLSSVTLMRRVGV